MCLRGSCLAEGMSRYLKQNAQHEFTTMKQPPPAKTHSKARSGRPPPPRRIQGGIDHHHRAGYRLHGLKFSSQQVLLLEVSTVRIDVSAVV
jgi:hypothetical protein